MLDEICGVNGLGKKLEIKAAGPRPGQDLNGSRLSTEENDACFRAKLPNRDRRFDPVDMGHEHVGKHEFGAMAAGRLDGLFPVVSGFRDEAIAVQDLNNRVRDKDFVVDHQDARRRSGAMRSLL